MIRDLIRIDGRRALITGAAGGLGSMIAATLAEIGAELILVEKPDVSCEDIEQRLFDDFQCRPEIYKCNLEDPIERSELIECFVNDDHELSVLVNNAAFVGTTALVGWSVPFVEQSIDTWSRAIEINLTAAFQLCQGLYPILKKSPGPTIINIASTYGSLAPDWSLYEGTSLGNPAAYSASKGGLIQLTRWLAATVAPEVRVNSISPGGIFRNQPKIFVDRYSARTPLKRMGVEDDFAGAIALLSSDLSRYMTGQNLIIDGGWGI